MTTADRTYFHVPEARSWHALHHRVQPQVGLVAFCGREAWDSPLVERVDRVPSDAHLCGNCSRVISATPVPR